MSSNPFSLIAKVSAVAVDAAALPGDATVFTTLSDHDLLAIVRAGADIGRAADRLTALAAGEVSRRSSHSLGQLGLAQRTGHRTPEELVRVTTGSTKRDALTAVRVGSLLHDGVADAATGELPAAREPWLAAVAAAVAAGSLSVACAESIRNGLGEPGGDVTVELLAEAAAQLVASFSDLDADRLFKRAREVRDDIDEAGIAGREETRRAQRSLKLVRLPDGGARVVWNLDPESAAVVVDLYDRMTSPRRGGPRFVSSDAAEQASRILDDNRTTEQLASDVMVDLVRAGAAADSSELLGSGAPVVRVLVTEKSLETGKGHGRIEGTDIPVSIATIERLVCAGSTQEIVFDDNLNPIDVGREQRLFTPKQRTALAARDGGCMASGCERPPSWCEAHHVDHWARDGGSTDVDNGILLCRYHHLLFHNQGWDLSRDQDGFWVKPPTTVDPARTPIPLPSKSAAMRDLRREREHERQTG